MADRSRADDESWRGRAGAVGPDAQGPFGAAGEDDRRLSDPQQERTIELKEEELVAHKEMRELGDVVVRTEVEDLPRRLEVEAFREEVEVEHVPIGQVVHERVAPWEQDDVLVVPVYEEQIVVTKRLLLREQLRVRRVGTTETQLFEDTVRHERVVIDDPKGSGLVRERFPVDEQDKREAAYGQRGTPGRERGGFWERLGSKLLR
jgi:uncharacterized protein (TIGR02271 family)